MIGCSYCQSTNTFIEQDGWVVCRECALYTSFSYDQAPGYKELKERIFTLCGQDLAKVNEVKYRTIFLQETHSLTHNLLEPLQPWQEYRNYYNLLIRLENPYIRAKVD